MLIIKEKIFYLEENDNKLEYKEFMENKECQDCLAALLLPECKEQKQAFLKIHSICTSLAYYLIMNEKIEHQNSWIKRKDLPSISELEKKTILHYMIITKIEEKTEYHILHELVENEEALYHYKQTLQMTQLINHAILCRDWDFINKLKDFIEEIPGYEWLTQLEEQKQVKKLTKDF